MEVGIRVGLRTIGFLFVFTFGVVIEDCWLIVGPCLHLMEGLEFLGFLYKLQPKS